MKVFWSALAATLSMGSRRCSAAKRVGGGLSRRRPCVRASGGGTCSKPEADRALELSVGFFKQHLA